MTDPRTPQTPPTPSRRTLLISTVSTIIGAALLLVLVVMPAEYGMDPTGFGSLVGLNSLSGESTETIEVANPVGGNENMFQEVEIPDFGEPIPLPNPEVFQDQANPPETRTMTVTLPAESETEIKMQLQEGKAIVYSWQTDQGNVYVDFHGHDPEQSDEYWVRYKEQQEGSGNNGSLTAPFSGEHGWYWLNYNTEPVEITLTITGYFEEIIDYGVF